MTTTRMAVVLAVLLLFAWVADAGAQTDPEQAVRDATATVVETTEDIAYGLETFSRTWNDSGSCGQTADDVLLDASRDGSLLSSQIQALEMLLDSADPEQEFVALEAVRRGEARLEALNDTLIWAPEGPDIGQVEWCYGFVNCLVLRHACTGCYKCYDGLTECGCFNPCP